MQEDHRLFQDGKTITVKDMSYTLRLNPDTIVRQSKVKLDVPIECLAGRHKDLRFGYNAFLGLPLITCGACGENLTQHILEGTKSKRELNIIERKAKTRRTTPEEVLDRLSLTQDEDRLTDPKLKELVKRRINQLEKNKR